MNRLLLLFLACICPIFSAYGLQNNDENLAAVPVSYPESCPKIFHHSMKQLHSSRYLNLCEVIDGRAVLLVNTASHCGFTGQLADLERIHQTYKDDGLVVIGVASDSFNQEADTEGDIAEVCYKNFGVTFTMLAPVSVRGDDAHELFREVASQDRYPLWNFFKFLIDPSGTVVSSNSSFRIPTDEELSALLKL